MLIQPVDLADFFLGFFTAAMIILLGALYAGLFAWAKISRRKRFATGAWLAYLALLVAVIVYSRINHFSGYWFSLSLVMALGYGLMPYVIWRLCHATHADESEHSHHSGGHHD